MSAAERLGALAALVGALGTLVSGDILGKIMTETQPMKMAAAEALYETRQPARGDRRPGSRQAGHHVWGCDDGTFRREAMAGPVG
ncbi:cytochrome ubiquinol oxidase subunit I [Nonomuraea sp. NPDC049695]|uniref:cytochrome ubiquinol oxidase subunit I n=1 Tax=Nonomuraea sp. NPDC049695 TaxID=3154734 RepID=UPI00343F092A